MHKLSILLFAGCLLAWCLFLPAQTKSIGGNTMTAHGPQTERAFFAAGCFWKVQYVFSKVPGVLRTRVGYSGGTTKNPSYQQVCAKGTGHAETVEVDFDPSKVTYDKLLQVFFSNHDPTTLNRQGPDNGTQYRSAIFCTSAAQKQAALHYKEELDKSHKFHAPIVTVIQDAAPFYDAEEYHQDYFVKHGEVCY